MSKQVGPELAQLQSSRVVVIALYVFCLATIGRTLVSAAISSPQLRPQLGLILGLELAFLLLYSVVRYSGGSVRVRSHAPWLHLYFSIQCVILLVAYLQAPDLDFITNLFILLAYQASLFLSGRMLWVWIGAFAVLTVGPLILTIGLLRGLGLGLVSMTVEMILAAYVVIDRELVKARARSEAMLKELQETHRQLERYAGEAAELTSIQERNRLAREIHDSVSQTLFSITLNTRAAQLLLEKNPTRVRAQLEQLQSLVQSALAEMRGLIAELRQTNES